MAPWHAAAWELARQRAFWADLSSAALLGLVGSWSLAWERLTVQNGPLAMFLSEGVSLVMFSQGLTAALLSALNPVFARSALGKAMLLYNAVGMAYHVRRTRSALASGPQLQAALAQQGGVRGMPDATWPMLASLLLPLQVLRGAWQLARTGRVPAEGGIERLASVPYAELDKIDPGLVAHNKVLTAQMKMLNTMTGRGRIAQWLTYDVVHDGVPGRAKPVLVYIHGGGWTVGDKMFAARALVNYLAQHEGVVVCSVNYRLAPEVSFPGQLHDLKRALWHIKQNVHTWGGDPAKVCVAGESAGGHLTALMALTANNRAYDPPEFTGHEDTSVCCAVDIYGVHDLADSEGHHRSLDKQLKHANRSKARITGLLESVVFRKSIAEDPEAFALASPSHLLDAQLGSAVAAAAAATNAPASEEDVRFEARVAEEVLSAADRLAAASPNTGQICPFLVVHGTRDQLAAYDDSAAFFERLVKIRKTTKSRVRDVFAAVSGGRHGFGYLPSPRSTSLALAIGAWVRFHTSPAPSAARL